MLNCRTSVRRMSKSAAIRWLGAAGLLATHVAAMGQGTAIVSDPVDMLDPSGDITGVTANVVGDALQLSMTVAGFAAPSVEQTAEGMNNRYYYHWLLDTDNNPATGRSNAEYEGNPTNLASPVGSDIVIQVGWRDGKPNGIYAYDPSDEDTAIVSDFSIQASGNTLTALIGLDALGLAQGQTIAVSAFQEGSSDGWAVDWIESAVTTLQGHGGGYAEVSDPVDMADSSGDITGLQGYVNGDFLNLSLTVAGFAGPTVDQTPEGMNNRYYYHFLLDTDDNPATGRSNAEYEGNPTNLTSPIGADLVVQVGWRDGKPNGIYVYDPADEDTAIVSDFNYQVSANTLAVVLSMESLGLVQGQNISISAFQEGSSDGWAVDWIESASLSLSGAGAGSALVSDDVDMADSSGDITGVQADVVGGLLHLSLKVAGFAGPTVEQTPEGMNNRYYYHFLLDTDNNPATGRSNVEYEGNPTNLTSPIGADVVIQIGWRDGKPNGVYAYDPADEDTAIVSDFAFQTAGNTLEAWIPMEALGLAPGQVISFSAFQEGSSDGWAVDWVESATISLDAPQSGGAASLSSLHVLDPVDMADSSGDITAVDAVVIGGNIHLGLTVAGFAGPSVDRTPEGMNNRYYYHWLLDTDNNPATGRSNSEYEGNPTNLDSPIGADLVIQVGWRDGKPNGVYVYDPADEDTAIVSNFNIQLAGNSLKAIIPLEALGLAQGQTIAVSAFQEGSSDGWAVDWVESGTLDINGGGLGTGHVVDEVDMADSSGDIISLDSDVVGNWLRLSLTVAGFAAPTVDQTPEGMNNRYYYHWLLDTDNNPATGRSNSEYEGNPTNLANPIGADLVVQLGWRDGKPNGIYVYDPADEDTAIISDFPYQASANTLTAFLPLEALGLAQGQTIAVSAFQEGSSDGWAVDWIESDVLDINGGGLGTAWVTDPVDMLDASGDITHLFATATGDFLNLYLTVPAFAGPTVDQTPEGMNNRYYYHFLLDTDDNPATGRSNSEYEGNPTNLENPIGADIVVQVGWRDGKPNGIYAYDPADEDTALVSDFNYTTSGNTLSASISMEALGLVQGQTLAVSGFQEGSSDGWAVDWVESAKLTLSAGGSAGFDVDTQFYGNGYSFTLILTDDGDNVVDPETIVARVDGVDVVLTVTKSGGVTTVMGVHPQLLAPESVATVSVSANVGGSGQSEDFIINVMPYVALPMDGVGQEGNANEPGFIVSTTMVTNFQIPFGVEGLGHMDMASLADQQMVDGLSDPANGIVFFNEAEDAAFTEDWNVTPVVHEGTINWYEMALFGEQSILNFDNDEPFPLIADISLIPMEGVSMEILTYLELEAGFHQLGLFSEGGHKVTAGWDPNGPVISLFENTEEVNKIPTYFARSQIFDVVAPQDGLYPIRILFFQSSTGEEKGYMLELYTVQDRQLHLVNDLTNPKSVRAYRSAIVIEQPEIQLSMEGGELILQWTGVLEVANDINGPWIPLNGTSPMVWDTSAETFQFARSRSSN